MQENLLKWKDGRCNINPIHPYSQALMQSILVPEKGMKDKKLPSLPGSRQTSGSTVGCRFADRCPLAIEECKRKEVKWYR